MFAVEYRQNCDGIDLVPQNADGGNTHFDILYYSVL